MKEVPCLISTDLLTKTLIIMQMGTWNQFRQEDFIRSYQVIFIVGISTESVCRGKGEGLHQPFVVLNSEVLLF